MSIRKTEEAFMPNVNQASPFPGDSKQTEMLSMAVDLLFKSSVDYGQNPSDLNLVHLRNSCIELLRLSRKRTRRERLPRKRYTHQKRSLFNVFSLDGTELAADISFSEALLYKQELGNISVRFSGMEAVL
jgi:hypothetical protein